MISFGRPEYTVQLKKMWHEIFGDTQSYIDSFFEYIWVADNTLVYTEPEKSGEKAVAALYMIPYRMKLYGKEIDIVYLYALVTEPEFRGRGIMSELMEMSEKVCRERGYSLSILIPAEKSLFEYYRRSGYSEFIKQTRLTQTREEVIGIASESHETELRPADSEVIWKVYRNSSFYEEGCVLLSKKQNEFYIKELENEGGEAYVFDAKSGSNNGYIFLRLDGENLNILESNVDSESLPSVYTALLKKYDFKTLTFLDPICVESSIIDKESHDCAMAKVLKAEDIQAMKEDINISKNGKSKRLFIGRVLM